MRSFRWVSLVLFCCWFVAASCPLRADTVLQPGGFELLYVTSDSAGSHTTTPGATAFGVNPDGVVDLITRDSSGIMYRSSGALLADGRHILTAAHSVTDMVSVDVRFHLPSGAQTYTSTAMLAHPSFDIAQYALGFDIGIITLPTEISSSIAPRYEIYRGSSEYQVQTVKVGYGQSGIGSTGATMASGTKRAGLNLYDADWDLVSDILGNTRGDPAAGLMLAYDFDSGQADNDYMGEDWLNVYTNLGFGANEVGAAPGDSGGPTFVFNALTSRYEIAGVTSFGFGVGLNPPDSSPGTNSSWGEISVDTRVSAFAGWVDSFAAPVPEPSTVVGLAGMALMALVAGLLRRAT